MGVHDITSDAENLLLAHVEVYAEALGIVDPLGPSEAAEAVAVAVGESQVVGVVGRADERNLIFVPEAVDVERGLIAVIRTVTGLHGAEPSVFHPFLYGKVDYGLVLAVIYARKTRQVALAVHYLEFVDHVDRQIFRRHFGIVGEEFLAVDKDFCNFLTVGGDFSVGVHFHSGKSLEQFLDHGVGLGLVAVGVELHGIGHHLDGGFHSHGRNLSEAYGGVPQAECIGGDVPVGDIYLAVTFSVTYVCSFQQVFSLPDSFQRESAVKVGDPSGNKRRVAGRQQPDCSIRQRLPTVVRDDAGNRIGPCGQGGRQKYCRENVAF